MSNPCCNQSPALLVDRQFGKSYRIVKAVYNKLPIIENLNESADLSFIAENFEEFQKISNVANDVVKISNHLDEILLADESARTATNFAQEAKDWAIKLNGTVDGIDYSSKYYALNAQDFSEKTKEYLNESKKINKEIQSLKKPIQKVIDNLKYIKTIVTNISDINIVASDLEAELINNASQDLGMIGEEEPPVQSISGGNIKVTADNIDDINICADNIQYIINLANKINSIPNTINNLEELVERTEKAAENSKTTLTEVTSISNSIKQEVSKVSAEGIKQRGLLGIEGDKQISLIKKETTDSIKNIQNTESTAIVNAEYSALKNIDSKKEETINIFSSYIENINNLSNRIEEINSSFENKVVVLQNNEENLSVVSSNIDSILKVSSKIEDISLIGSDLEGSWDIGGVIDYGNLDEPNSGSAVIYGGNIYIVAQNMDVIKKVANNIDKIDMNNYYTKEEVDTKIAVALKNNNFPPS